jgi:hypothetical protein
MNTEQPQKLFANAATGSISPVQSLASRVIAGSQYEEPAQKPDEWQDRLRSLEQWVCELLIKNQELRLALESSAAQGKVKQNG